MALAVASVVLVSGAGGSVGGSVGGSCGYYFSQRDQVTGAIRFPGRYTPTLQLEGWNYTIWTRL